MNIDCRLFRDVGFQALLFGGLQAHFLIHLLQTLLQFFEPLEFRQLSFRPGGGLLQW